MLFPSFIIASVLLGVASKSFALPARINVALFDSHAPLQELCFYGPCVVETHRSFRLSAGKYSLYSSRLGGFLIRRLSIFDEQPILLPPERSLRIHRDDGAAIHLQLPYDFRRAKKADNSRNRFYKGTLVFHLEQPGADGKKTKSHAAVNFIRVVNIVHRRDYLTSVVASEMPRGAPLEALKAQAVLALTQVSRLTDAQTIQDSTQIQSYSGVSQSRPEIFRAIQEAGDQILEYNGRPAEAYFHSTCAGRTSTASAIFGGKQNLPYLTNVACTYCKNSPFWRETVSIIPESEFETVFGATIPIVSEKDLAGRPTLMSYSFGGKSVTSNGYQFWLKLGQSFGWGKAPGTKFELTKHDREVFIKSTGAGHGVGMCQYGAIGMALKGKNYQEILAFYFPGTRLSAHFSHPLREK